jgi:hypothetical protein
LRLFVNFATNPDSRKYYELIIDYAKARGGFTLEFWKLLQVAAKLGQPVSEMEKIHAQTVKAIEPKWRWR